MNEDTPKFDPSRPLRDIVGRMRGVTAQRRTKHPGSKRRAKHGQPWKGNTWRAVTRPRRNSWNHLRKEP